MPIGIPREKERRSEPKQPLYNEKTQMAVTNSYIKPFRDRKTEEDILALRNCCPHLGTSNRWSYSNGEFRCANHGNSYGTGIGFAANCSSNSTSGNLKQYKTEINQDILIVNFDT